MYVHVYIQCICIELLPLHLAENVWLVFDFVNSTTAEIPLVRILSSIYYMYIHVCIINICRDFRGWKFKLWSSLIWDLQTYPYIRRLVHISFPHLGSTYVGVLYGRSCSKTAMSDLATVLAGMYIHGFPLFLSFFLILLGVSLVALELLGL